MKACSHLVVTFLFALAAAAGGAAAQGKAPAKFDKVAVDREVTRLVKKHGNGVLASVWLGGADGAAWFETTAATARPTASAIKAFYLVELFARHKDKLDDELPGARAVLKDDRHPAVAHFTPTQRDEIRRELTGATVRKVGEVMIGRAKVSNAVYNAAANVTTAVLDGPEALTKAIRARDPAFKDVFARRYMLTDRTKPGDNEATAAALAAVHQRLAAKKLAGVDDKTMAAIRGVLRGETDAVRGTHYSKGGNLTTDPLTEVRAGWWETPDGPIVYAVMTAQPTPGGPDRLKAAAALAKTATGLTDLLVAAGSKAIKP